MGAYLMQYFDFTAAVAIAAGVLTLLTVPLMIILEAVKPNKFFTSAVLFEAIWLTILSIIWLASGGVNAVWNIGGDLGCDVADAINDGISYADSDSDDIDYGASGTTGIGAVCSMPQVLMAFSFASWVLLFFYVMSIMICACVSSSRRQAPAAQPVRHALCGTSSREPEPAARAWLSRILDTSNGGDGDWNCPPGHEEGPPPSVPVCGCESRRENPIENATQYGPRDFGTLEMLSPRARCQGGGAGSGRSSEPEDWVLSPMPTYLKGGVVAQPRQRPSEPLSPPCALLTTAVARRDALDPRSGRRVVDDVKVPTAHFHHLHHHHPYLVREPLPDLVAVPRATFFLALRMRWPCRRRTRRLRRGPGDVVLGRRDWCRRAWQALALAATHLPACSPHSGTVLPVVVRRSDEQEPLTRRLCGLGRPVLPVPQKAQERAFCRAPRPHPTCPPLPIAAFRPLPIAHDRKVPQSPSRRLCTRLYDVYDLHALDDPSPRCLMHPSYGVSTRVSSQIPIRPAFATGGCCAGAGGGCAA
uniref:MARVEL domain-containing protein n=1 Tax=Mycena chlorophos TaxID=658473 RepID=A0ABQ0M014_MYCCL|nr:predicted protein [Mycena chlorophos]